MDSTVAAAWITVGGVTVTAVAGFGSTQLAARRAARQSADNVERTLQAEHERRLWDEKVKLYAAILADVAHRKLARASDLKRYVLVEADQHLVNRELASFEPMSRFEFDARARMFASSDVEAKLRAAAEANTALYRAGERREAAVSEGSESQKLQASEEFTAALERANVADQLLSDAIRLEIESLPPRSRASSER